MAISSPENFEYAAFISYRREIPNDALWARAIQRFLEGYRAPRSRSIPNRRVGRVFRDDTELPAVGFALDSALASAIQKSKILLVICSPTVPSSMWINAEVEEFLRSAGINRVLTLLSSGPKDESSLPPCLQEYVQATGATWATPSFGYSIDLRNVKPGNTRQCKPAMLKIIAAILDMSYDDLWRREARRIWKRRLAAGATIASTSLLSYLLYDQVTDAERELAESRRTEDLIRRQKAAIEEESDQTKKNLKLDRTIREAAELRDTEPEKAARLLLDHYVNNDNYASPRLEMAMRDWDQRAVRHSWELPAPIMGHAWSIHRELAFQALPKGGIRIVRLDVDTKMSYEEIPACLYATDMSFSPDGNRLAIAGIRGGVEVWNRQNPTSKWVGPTFQYTLTPSVDSKDTMNPVLDWRNDDEFCVADRHGNVAFVDLHDSSVDTHQVVGPVNAVSFGSAGCLISTDDKVGLIAEDTAGLNVLVPKGGPYFGTGFLGDSNFAIASSDGLMMIGEEVDLISDEQVIAVEQHPRGGVVYGTTSGMIARTGESGDVLFTTQVGEHIGRLSIAPDGVVAQSGFGNHLNIIDQERPRRWYYDLEGKFDHQVVANLDVLNTSREGKLTILKLDSEESTGCRVSLTEPVDTASLFSRDGRLGGVIQTASGSGKLVDLETCDFQKDLGAVCENGSYHARWLENHHVGWGTCGEELVKTTSVHEMPKPVGVKTRSNLVLVDRQAIVISADYMIGELNSSASWRPVPSEISRDERLEIRGALESDVLVIMDEHGPAIIRLSDIQNPIRIKHHLDFVVDYSVRRDGQYVALLEPAGNVEIFDAHGERRWKLKQIRPTETLLEVSWSAHGDGLFISNPHEIFKLEFSSLQMIAERMNGVISLAEELAAKPTSGISCDW